MEWFDAILSRARQVLMREYPQPHLEHTLARDVEYLLECLRLAKADDPDYTPAYQDEYQRLWHVAAEQAKTAEARADTLEAALQEIAYPDEFKKGVKGQLPFEIARRALGLSSPTREQT
jgi:hypothetical protein